MLSNYSFYIKNIIDAISEVMPINCKEIHCLCEVEKNKNSYSSGFYYKYNENYYYVYDLDKSDCFTKEQADTLINYLNENALDLYDSFIADGQPCWEAVEIHMINGKTTGKFYYDWFERELGPLARRVVWAYESFGLKPETGSYNALVLDRYIKSKG